MAALWISAIFCFLVGSATSEFLTEICSIPKRSDGIIQPPLPTNFELKGQYVNYLQNFTSYEEIYFDYDHSRAKYMYLMNGIQHHFLFDYETEQIVEWDILHPGVSIKRDPLSHVCTAVAMDDAPQRNFFGYQVAQGSLKPRMYNSNQVLRYGGQYLYAANGTQRLDDRGLLCNKFVGCVYDRLADATMLNTYYFSSDKVEPAGATSREVVFGLDDGYLSVPVKLEVTGAWVNGTGDAIPLNESLSISWFKGEPEFPMDTFQIPPWIHCKNYRGRKDMPKLPTAFSTRLAVTQFQVDILGEMAAAESESFEEIYYYGEKNLARRDFTPNPYLDTDIFEKFQSYSPVSTIYDFNQGLRYTISKPTGRCYIGPIQENEFFDTEKDLLDRRLATPEEIFLMQMDDMEYKGKAFTRDIECDVWNGRHFHKLYNSTFTKETYISTNGWHAGVDEKQEYGIPVKHMLIKAELDGELVEGGIAYNFLKFKAKAPWVGQFDVRNCVEQITHKRFAIVLSVSNEVRDLLFEYKFQFHETAQYYISDMAQVMTPLRVQRLHLRRQAVNDPTPILVFTLLDKADLDDYPVPVGQKGASLDEAIINLQKVVDYSRFAIEFYPPKSTEPKLVAAREGDMYMLLPGGDLTLTPMKRLKEADKRKPEKTKLTKLVEANLTLVQKADSSQATGKEEEGMTPGHLALLSLAMLCIGIAIGIASMYLYIRMYSDRHVDDKINLTTKKSELESRLEGVEESPSE